MKGFIERSKDALVRYLLHSTPGPLVVVRGFSGGGREGGTQEI